jgi:hypothetical protein
LFAAQLESVIGVVTMGPSSLAAPPSSLVVASISVELSSPTEPEPEPEPDSEPDDEVPDEELPLLEEGTASPEVELQLAAASAIDRGRTTNGIAETARMK